MIYILVIISIIIVIIIGYFVNKYLILRRTIRFVDKGITPIMNTYHEKEVEKIIDEYWSDLSMKERYDILKYCGADLVCSYNKGVLEKKDLTTLRKLVKKRRIKYDKLDREFDED